MNDLSARHGRRVGWAFVAFFAGIAAVNAIMVTLALRTHSGTVTDHPYEKGLAYNRVVEAEEAQEKLGWHATIEFAHGKLHVALQDRSGKILTPDTLQATFTRPSQQGMDFAMELNNPETAIPFPANGLWEVRIFATANGHRYQQSRRIVVP